MIAAMKGKNYITAEIKARAKELAETVSIGVYALGAPKDDREIWEKAARHTGAPALFQKAKTVLQEDIAVIDDALYYSAERLGHSGKINRVQSALVRNLEDMLLAECMENKGRFLPKIEAYIETICTMKSWVNAGHDRAFGYAQYRNRCGLVDLYTAGIVWAFIACDSCLGEQLSGNIRQMMRDSVQTRALDIYERKLRGETDKPLTGELVPLYWLDVFGNWIAVCSGAMTAGMLYFGEEDKKALYIAVYEHCMAQYAKSLKNGYCAEGLSYWNYGFAHFIAGADAVARATGGAVDLYLQGDLCRAAKFGLDFTMTKDDYPAIADCMFGEQPSSFNLCYYHMRRAEHTELPADLLTGYHVNFALCLLAWESKLSGTMQERTGRDPLRSMYDGYDVLVCRNQDMTLGACIKGGTNQEPHNHNDLGTFVISVKGESVIADVGYTRYTNTTFEKERYREAALSSFGHSVPVVGGCLQGPAEFKCDVFDEVPPFYATVLEKHFTEMQDELLLDLTPAYACPHLKQLTRTFTFCRKEKKVEILDCYAFDSPDTVESAFLTFGSVEIEGNKIVVRGKNAAIKVCVPPSVMIKVTPISGVVVNDHRDAVYPVRIGIRKKEKESEGQLKLIFRAE